MGKHPEGDQSVAHSSNSKATTKSAAEKEKDMKRVRQERQRQEEEKSKNQKKDFFRLIVNPHVEKSSQDFLTKDYYKRFLGEKSWSERVSFYGLTPHEKMKL